jgi:hypothetical protein
MTIVQAIGFPCTGKSTFLRRYVSEHLQWKLYDIVDFRDTENWLLAENKMLKKMVDDQPGFAILESAQGIHGVHSCNILFKCDMRTLNERHKRRGIELTNDLLEYYSMLMTVGVKTYITVDTNNSYEHLLAQFFKAIEISRDYSVDRESSIRRRT